MTTGAENILLGIGSSLILLILIEVRDLNRDKKQYGYLAGKYKREERYNEDKTKIIDSKWKLVTTNDNPNLELIYKGSREYYIPQIHYDEHWIATATIFLDATNTNRGSGIYQYTKKADSIKVDFGEYNFFVDVIDNRRLYVFHQNYLPSGLSVGYEVWVRQ